MDFILILLCYISECISQLTIAPKMNYNKLRDGDICRKEMISMNILQSSSNSVERRALWVIDPQTRFNHTTSNCTTKKEMHNYNAFIFE